MKTQPVIERDYESGDQTHFSTDYWESDNIGIGFFLFILYNVLVEKNNPPSKAGYLV